jgi:hypothetical protein
VSFATVKKVLLLLVLTAPIYNTSTSLSNPQRLTMPDVIKEMKSQPQSDDQTDEDVRDECDDDTGNVEDEGETGPISGGGPGAYGEQQAQDGVEFVVLNDDVLTSVANATTVLVDGSDLERMAVLYQFPQFLEHCPDDSISMMVPVICDGAVGWKEDVQMAAAEALYFVVNMPLPEIVAKQIVVCALSIIQMSASGGEVFDACGEILSMMLPQVKRQVVLDLVVPATTERAVSPAPESRRLAARIIGSLNDSMTSEEIEKMFLNQALDLASDDDPSVRAMISQSMTSVGSKLPLRISEKHLWPKLRVLMSDSNARVRAAAMRAIARSAEAHKAHAGTSEMYRYLLLPMFLSECAKASDIASSDLRSIDDDTYLMLEIFSEVYGYFLCAVSPLFQTEDTWTAALNTLRRMVTCNGPTVRHWCAFNMPAISSVCARGRTDKIKGVVQALSVDLDIETRATLAAGIHETTHILGQGPLREEIVQAIADLMSDSSPQVRMNSLSHFAELLTTLSKGDLDVNTNQSNTSGDRAEEIKELKPDSMIRGLAPIFSSFEAISMDSWRTQELLATELKKCAYLIPQDMLCEHVAPLLFQMARESTYLVRRASMQALIHVIRYIPDVRRRNHILKHFRTEWARGKVYWTRLAFIDGAQSAQQVFSAKLFDEMFKEELLEMSIDPVPNVRLRLVRFFTFLASHWKGVPEFQAAVRALANDSDSQVAKDARALMHALHSLKCLSPEEILEDKKREEAELVFFVAKGAKKKKTAKTPSTGVSGCENRDGSNREDASDRAVTDVLASSADIMLPYSSNKPTVGAAGTTTVKQLQIKPEAVALAGAAPGIETSRPTAASPIKRAFCGCFGGG